jgi:hypothetical protein
MPVTQCPTPVSMNAPDGYAEPPPVVARSVIAFRTKVELGRFANERPWLNSWSIRLNHVAVSSRRT